MCYIFLFFKKKNIRKCLYLVFVIDFLYVYKVIKFEILNVLILKDMYIFFIGECIYVYWNIRILCDLIKNIKF